MWLNEGSAALAKAVLLCSSFRRLYKVNENEIKHGTMVRLKGTYVTEISTSCLENFALLFTFTTDRDKRINNSNVYEFVTDAEHHLLLIENRIRRIYCHTFRLLQLSSF